MDFTTGFGSGIYIRGRHQKNVDFRKNHFTYFESMHEDPQKVIQKAHQE